MLCHPDIYYYCVWRSECFSTEVSNNTTVIRIYCNHVRIYTDKWTGETCSWRNYSTVGTAAW